MGRGEITHSPTQITRETSPGSKVGEGVFSRRSGIGGEKTEFDPARRLLGGFQIFFQVFVQELQQLG